jgi:mannose-6-phosphate isomerase-like protein (cupin superfamily)
VLARTPIGLRSFLVRVENLDAVEPFTTLDGSTIREVAGPAIDSARNQSLAEASVPPGGSTAEHYHRTTEEIYFFTHGSGRMRLGDEEREVGPGDTVVITPGTRHKVWNSGDEPLRLLCCCAPAYSHEDTVLTE